MFCNAFTDVVRDIVHPALYCYNAKAKGAKPVSSKTFPPPVVWPMKDQDDDEDGDEGENKTREADFWGRKFEKSVFQWMPTYFDIDTNGKCKIKDYINNLVFFSRPHISAFSVLTIFAIVPFLPGSPRGTRKTVQLPGHPFFYCSSLAGKRLFIRSRNPEASKEGRGGDGL